VPAPCDIEKTGCQAAVLSLTACVRGNHAPPAPDVRVIELAALREELESMDAEGESSSATDAALAALHLLAAGRSLKESLIDAQTDSVAAYYDDEAKRVTIVDRSRVTADDTLAGMYELSHELTHYLQDRDPGIAATMERFGPSLDGIEAGRSLIEGEAVVTSTRVLAALSDRDPTQLIWSNITRELTASVLNDVRMSRAPLAVASVELPYLLGTPYIAKAWSLSNRERVDGLFDESPTSAVDWLAGYGKDGPLPSLQEPLDCGPPLAPDGFALVDLDSFGIVGAAALLAAARDRSELTLVRALVGDSIGIYSAGGGDNAEALAAWRMRFRTDTDAKSFATAVSGLMLQSRRFDNELVFVASSDEGSRPFNDAALEACPALSDLRAQLERTE
jgi:hypothetical protein